MTARGRALVITAFVLAAALCGSAAVALVVASDDSAGPLAALPSPSPTTAPTTQPTTAPPTPTPSRPPTIAATASSTPFATPPATPAATPSRMPSATPRSTTAVPTRSATAVPGLAADASVAEASGATAYMPIHVKAHATDGDGSISLLSLDWGDGSPQVSGGRGTPCSPPAKSPADCRNFAWTYTYGSPGNYTITIWFVSGLERTRLLLPVTIS